MKLIMSSLIVVAFFSGFSQTKSILKGRIFLDTPQLETIHIVNLTKELGVINDQYGYFEIKADPEDIIVFSSIQFQLKKHTVTIEDLQSGDFQVFLKVAINELDEVRISQYSLSGDIENDIKEIPTYENKLPLWNAAQLKKMRVSRPNDEQSPVENLVLKNDNLATITIDLDLLINLITKGFRNKKKENSFKASLIDYYKEDFFIKELHIPETEYYNFLDFVNENTSLKNTIDTGDELKLLEFLIEQSQVFKEKYGVRK